MGEGFGGRRKTGRKTDPVPGIGERVVVLATGTAGSVEDRTRCRFTGKTYLRVVPDEVPYPLVQSSLSVGRETP